MRVMIAARTLGETSGWRLTNLEMQKTLYVAHMLHMGRTGSSLVDEEFEAWDFGPVLPTLYKYARNFKRSPIPPFSDYPAFSVGTLERCAVEDAYSFTRHLGSTELVRLTHRAGGAWDANYIPQSRNEKIRDADILEEFQLYMSPSAEAVAWAEEMADEVEAAPSRYLENERMRAFRARVLQGCLQ